jgi:hypothetical protein
MPVLVLALLLITCFWISIPLLAAGLFLGCRYRFRGPELEKTGMNHVMDAAADVTASFKQEVIHSTDPAGAPRFHKRREENGR